MFPSNVSEIDLQRQFLTDFSKNLNISLCDCQITLETSWVCHNVADVVILRFGGMGALENFPQTFQSYAFFG